MTKKSDQNKNTMKRNLAVQRTAEKRNEEKKQLRRALLCWEKKKKKISWIETEWQNVSFDSHRDSLLKFNAVSVLISNACVCPLNFMTDFI